MMGIELKLLTKSDKKDINSFLDNTLFRKEGFEYCYENMRIEITKASSFLNDDENRPYNILLFREFGPVQTINSKKLLKKLIEIFNVERSYNHLYQEIRLSNFIY